MCPPPLRAGHTGPSASPCRGPECPKHEPCLMFVPLSPSPASRGRPGQAGSWSEAAWLPGAADTPATSPQSLSGGTSRAQVCSAGIYVKAPQGSERPLAQAPRDLRAHASLLQTEALQEPLCQLCEPGPPRTQPHCGLPDSGSVGPGDQIPRTS